MAPSVVSPIPGAKRWSVPGDFEKIQAAIDAASEGHTILVAKGEFQEKLTLKKGLTLRGAGRDATFAQLDGRAGVVVAAMDATGVAIEGIAFSHKDEFVSPGGNPVAQFSRCKDIQISTCSFSSGGQHGVQMSSSTGASLKDCVFENNARSGIWIDSGSQVVLENSRASYNLEAGATIRDDGSRCSITDSHFSDNEQHGVEITDQAEVTVSGKCGISGNGESGLYAEGAGTSIRVERGDIVGNGVGVLIKDGTRAELVSAAIRENDLGASFKEAGDSTLQGSQIELNKLSGVAIEAESGSARLYIEGNTVTGNADFGFFVAGRKARPNLSGNRFGPNGKGDVLIMDSAKATIAEGNVFSSGQDIVLETGGSIEEVKSNPRPSEPEGA